MLYWVARHTTMLASTICQYLLLACCLAAVYGEDSMFQAPGTVADDMVQEQEALADNMFQEQETLADNTFQEEANLEPAEQMEATRSDAEILDHAGICQPINTLIF